MEVRYIEIKTSPAGQIIRAYTPEQYKKEMARRKNATARARKLTRLQERVGAVLAMLGFLMPAKLSPTLAAMDGNQAAIFDEMKKAIDETLEELSDYRVAFAVEDTADERTEEK